LPFYFIAGLALAMEILPADAWAIFGRAPMPGRTWPISLAIGGVMLTIGVILHRVFYRLDPERFDVAAFRWCLTAMAILSAVFFTSSVILSRTTGLPPHVQSRMVDRAVFGFGTIAVGFLGLLVILLFGWLFLAVKLQPANRMARRIAVGDYVGAIRIGEARPLAERDFTTCANLVSAYALAGQTEKARELLDTLERTEGIPKPFTEETWNQTLARLREQLEHPST
jgi:pentatricopeptide repeat protein